MTVACFYCCVGIPNNQAKRCSRCCIAIYCSKECQALSWKAAHKVNCSLNSTAAALNSAKPAKLSEIDKLMGKWMVDWRRCFMVWTILALDLANHPLDRAVTHCLHMTVEPRLSQTKSYEKLHVVHAAVVLFSFIQKTYPELAMKIDLTDFTRFRCAITLHTPGGMLTRVRLLEWSVLNTTSLAALWNQRPTDETAALAEGVPSVLMSSVGHMSPDIVERLGLLHYPTLTLQ